MANTVEFVSFNLNVFLSTQKGYISRKLLRDGEMWADSVLWETKEDVLRVYKNADEDAAACEYFSFMDEESVKVLILPIERSY